MAKTSQRLEEKLSPWVEKVNGDRMASWKADVRDGRGRGGK